MIQRRLGLKAVRFRPDTLRALMSYEWPGNVRELENLISRAVLRASTEQTGAGMIVVAPGHLGVEFDSPVIRPESGRKTPRGGRLANEPLRVVVDDFQRDLIRAAVAGNAGNWAAAARELGINRSNLHKLARRLGIKNPRP
jgi:anaerobic nitric oxide reductase transcription regulator